MISKNRIIHYIKHSFFIFGLVSILWLIFRSGAKPSRLTYPCQQAAAVTGYLWIFTYLALPVTALLSIRRWATPGKVALTIVGILFTCSLFTVLYITNGSSAAISIEEPSMGSEALGTQFTSDIFIVQGKTGYNGGFTDLLTLMRENGLEFYQYSNPSAPKGLIGKDDVIILKVNCQWPERGGTNTDLVKAVIEAILAHPEGFTGEIVVADNGQGRGSFSWPNANAEDTGQSMQDVVDSFSGSHRVSTYLWDSIRNTMCAEYDQGDIRDGYIINTTPNSRTGLEVSYPKFRTKYGTNISFRKGVWENGAYNTSRLKLINIPVLKSHNSYEVTANLKHYVGVVSVPLGDPHASIDRGGMGTAMVETRYPDLNILDATWVNAIPQGYSGAGPNTPYSIATRADTIAASTDPIALDYYAAKYILMPRAAALGYAIHSMDPDNIASGYFGSWLRAAMQEIRFGGYQVTTDENQMNIFITTADSITVDVPNGGENWKQGSSQTIRWTYTGSPGSDVKIELLQGMAVDTLISSNTSIGSSGSGSKSWTLPYNQALGTNYKIRVTSTSNAACTDTSDAPFNISAGESIIVRIPNGGENWEQGSTQTIRWDYTGNPGPIVKITLLKGTAVLGVVTPSTSIGSSGSGSYSLTVPYNMQLGTDYKIRVTSTSNASYTDTSDAFFTIGANPSSSSITVVAPNGGENWPRSSTQTIRWTYTGNPGPTVRIEALKGTAVLRVITPSTSIGSGGSGSYSLTIPYNTPLSNDYKIRIVSTSNSAYRDTSDVPFTIGA